MLPTTPEQVDVWLHELSPMVPSKDWQADTPLHEFSPMTVSELSPWQEETPWQELAGITGAASACRANGPT
jgi:hypothetical protein